MSMECWTRYEDESQLLNLPHIAQPSRNTKSYCPTGKTLGILEELTQHFQLSHGTIDGQYLGTEHFRTETIAFLYHVFGQDNETFRSLLRDRIPPMIRYNNSNPGNYCYCNLWNPNSLNEWIGGRYLFIFCKTTPCCILKSCVIIFYTTSNNSCPKKKTTPPSCPKSIIRPSSRLAFYPTWRFLPTPSKLPKSYRLIRDRQT